MLASSPPLLTDVAAEATAADDAWRSAAALRLVAYRGGSDGGGSSSFLTLSSGRCFVPQRTVWQMPVTLDAQLLWSAVTADAPRTSMLRLETALARHVTAMLPPCNRHVTAM